MFNYRVILILRIELVKKYLIREINNQEIINEKFLRKVLWFNPKEMFLSKESSFKVKGSKDRRSDW